MDLRRLEALHGFDDCFDMQASPSLEKLNNIPLQKLVDFDNRIKIGFSNSFKSKIDIINSVPVINIREAI